MLSADRNTTSKTLTVIPEVGLAAQGTVLALAAGESSETGDGVPPACPPQAHGPQARRLVNSLVLPVASPARRGSNRPWSIAAVQLWLGGRSDGVENNQTSWVGEGFELGTAFIERPYKTCADDGTAAKGRLCWAGDRQSVSFGKWSGELVRIDAGTADEGVSTWRLRADNGARFQRQISTGLNDDNNGEYWIMTTPDGTKYYFGQDKLTSASTADRNSAWTVPVFGNNSGEPCNAAPGWCQQAWRWNLDRVVDPNRNTTLYSYTPETNKYALNGSTATTYVRGGYLAKFLTVCV